MRAGKGVVASCDTRAGGEPNWIKIGQLLEELYDASDGLAAIFPGRLFTLDGHLVGSVGEVIAAYMFDLTLTRASMLGHDALAADGREVEIKFTQRRSIAIRHKPMHLIALCRPRGGPVEVVYNGPGEAAWQMCGPLQSNGQRVISLSRLSALDRQVVVEAKLPIKRAPPV
jgi:hypothetical protein